MSALTMCVEHGIYVDGIWHAWVPKTTTTTHGWKSSADAVAEWKTHGLVNRYLNGRERSWGQSTGVVKVAGQHRTGAIVQRVWFEGEPVGQLAFDLAGAA